MATNRADTLDPALLRPGRLDRKIEFPVPDRRQKRLIFQVVTSKMNLSDEVDLEDYISRPDKISGAQITAICQEAGMQAVRKVRKKQYQSRFHSPRFLPCFCRTVLSSCPRFVVLSSFFLSFFLSFFVSHRDLLGF